MCHAQISQTYTCGPSVRGSRALAADSVFSSGSAGFDLNSKPDVQAGACRSDRPFFFSAPLPEGSYRVTVVLGGPATAVTTVRAEARRLMLEKIPTRPRVPVTRSFDVNLRAPQIDSQIAGSEKEVKLKPREVGNLDWDAKLTLEFNGEWPSVRSITVAPIHEPTVYLAGDSTVVDQDIEPWAAWGQMLPRFFKPGVVIANHAESGETIKSFVSEGRFAKIFSLIRPGDYLFLQFGHNDQKPNAVSLTDYKRLLTEYVALTRKAGATPVLVTNMNRRTFDSSGHITNSLAGYPDAVREIAAGQKAALIDLNAMSKTIFETLGPDLSMKAFMHYPANAFPNQTQAISDDTHFNSYGAYELARAVIHGIRQAKLPLAKFLAPDVPDFDPIHPDAQPTFSLPPTPIQLRSDVTRIPQT